MKEKEFIDYISNIDTDFSMDKKIIKQVFDYDEATNENNNILRNTNAISYIKERFQLMRTLPKVAAALIIVTVLGTATAFAAGYFVKVFSPEIIYTESEGTSVDYTTIDKSYIKGSEPITNEYGSTIGYNRIPDAAEEAFAIFNLPNLVPTYLLDNYYIDLDGYVIESLSYDDITFKMLRAYFISDVQRTKQVFFWFTPEEHSVKDVVFDYSNLSSKNFTQTTYITKSGLPCIIEDYNIDNHYLNVYILYDSDTLGNDLYRLEFSPNIEMEEVEAVLDSIPISSDGVLTN